MSNPLVSIIIPTFNRAHLIAETLDSVLAQTYTNWECIIVDDGSTDNTEELITTYIKRDARFQYHHRPKERLKGGNAARNYGFEVCNGDYVNWFDSDDVMSPNKIQYKMNLILNADYDFVVCKGAIYESLPVIEPIPWPLHLDGNVLLNHIRGRISFVTNGPLFKKEFLNSNKPLFNEKLTVRQEWEFFNRLLMKYPKITIYDSPLYYYRRLNSGIRGQISFDKYKSRLVAERLTLLNINKYGTFNEEEDYIFRKMVFRRGLDFFKSFPLKTKIRLLPYILNTFVINLNLNFLKVYFLNRSR